MGIKISFLTKELQSTEDGFQFAVVALGAFAPMFAPYTCPSKCYVLNFFSIPSQVTLPGFGQREYCGLGSNLDRWLRSPMFCYCAILESESVFFLKYEVNEMLKRYKLLYRALCA